MDPIREMYDIATEGFMSSIRERIKNHKKSKVKSEPVDKAPAVSSEAERVFNEQYRDKIVELGNEISKHLQSSNLAGYDHMEIAGVGNFDMSISHRGSCTLAVYHWQSYDGETDKPVPPAAILEKERKNMENDFVDDDTTTTAWAMDKVEKEFAAVASKFASKARAIHPKCSVKVRMDDVDILYIDFNKEWLNA